MESCPNPALAAVMKKAITIAVTERLLVIDRARRLAEHVCARQPVTVGSATAAIAESELF